MALFNRSSVSHPLIAKCIVFSLLWTTLTYAFIQAPAGAAEKKPASARYRLLVLPYASIHGMLPAQVGEKSAHFLQTELADVPDVRLVQLTRPADLVAVVNPTPERNKELLNRALQLSAEARAAIENGDFSLAITKFHQAIDLEISQHPYIEFSGLVNHYIGLAEASFQLGEEEEGVRYLEEAARFDPARKLDSTRLPPIFTRTFDDLVRQINGRPRAGLNVDASIQNARIFLDGKELGMTPLRRDDLLPGKHFLRIVPDEGSTLWAQPIELISGQTLKVMAKIDLIGGALAEIERELSQNQLSRAVIVRAMELARQADATHVVLGGVHQEKSGIAVTSFLLSMRDQTVCALQETLFDAEMLSAGIELYKVGADLIAQMAGCKSPRKLPSPVAPRAPTRTAQASFARPNAIAAFLNHTHTPASKHHDAPPPPVPVMADAPRNVELQPPVAASIEDEPDISTPWSRDREGTAVVKKEDRNLTWLWITLGVVAAAGLATGGYFIYDAAQKPTGQGTVTWTP